MIGKQTGVVLAAIVKAVLEWASSLFTRTTPYEHKLETPDAKLSAWRRASIRRRLAMPSNSLHDRTKNPDDLHRGGGV